MAAAFCVRAKMRMKENVYDTCAKNVGHKEHTDDNTTGELCVERVVKNGYANSKLCGENEW